jgi:hypothetical protein
MKSIWPKLFDSIFTHPVSAPLRHLHFSSDSFSFPELNYTHISHKILLVRKISLLTILQFSNLFFSAQIVNIKQKYIYFFYVLLYISYISTRIFNNVHVHVSLLIQCSTFLFCTDGLNATVKFISKPETKNGKVYWNVVKCELNIKSLENFKVNFDNLFNGDKTLGKYKSMQPNTVEPLITDTLINGHLQ